MAVKSAIRKDIGETFYVSVDPVFGTDEATGFDDRISLASVVKRNMASLDPQQILDGQTVSIFAESRLK
jgi:hypothetical protein